LGFVYVRSFVFRGPFGIGNFGWRLFVFVALALIFQKRLHHNTGRISDPEAIHQSTVGKRRYGRLGDDSKPAVLGYIGVAATLS
jgi:hypothetical protein